MATTAASGFDLHASRDALVGLLVALLRDCPDEWVDDHYTLRHKPTGLEIWICNGFWFVALKRPSAIKFGAVGKVRVWWALRRHRRHLRVHKTDHKTIEAAAAFERVHAAIANFQNERG